MSADIAPVETLADLAARANVEHHAYETTQRAALAHAIAAGEALIEAKRLAGHGRWLPWIEANCDFGERTARRYMLLARNRSHLSDLPSVTAALARLANRSEAMAIDEPRIVYDVRCERGHPDFEDPHGRVLDDPDPVRGLFRWMGPWVAECPCCGKVTVVPRPATRGEITGWLRRVREAER
jgi:hypothetical protein